MTTPAQPSTPSVMQRVDRIDSRLRQTEATVAQLVDVLDIYGPPPQVRRLPIPELTAEQRRTVWLAIALIIAATLQAVYAGRKVIQ